MSPLNVSSITSTWGLRMTFSSSSFALLITDSTLESLGDFFGSGLITLALELDMYQVGTIVTAVLPRSFRVWRSSSIPVPAYPSVV